MGTEKRKSGIGAVKFALFGYAEAHTHDEPPKDCVRYIYVMEGELTFSARQSEKITAGTHAVVFIPEGCRYSSDWTENTEVFVADVGFPNKVAEEKQQEIRLLYYDRRGTLMKPIGELLETCSYSQPFLFMERASVLMHVLSEMAESEQREGTYSLIRQSVLYLNAHFTEETPVEQLAALCSFSPSHFRRLFREYYRMTPIEYRNRLRIREAERLLKSGGYTVARAAETVGIADPGYFARLFRRYLGRAPRNA